MHNVKFENSYVLFPVYDCFMLFSVERKRSLWMRNWESRTEKGNTLDISLLGENIEILEIDSLKIISAKLVP